MNLDLLTYTTLYPNAAQPHHGIFVEQRLRQLMAAAPVAARVVAPVPWFPFSDPVFGRYAQFSRAPRDEQRYGIYVDHPRFPVLPKVGVSISPLLLRAWTASSVRRHLEERDFDLIDSHYFYPDGVAAVDLGARLGKPVVITARGSDVTLLTRYPNPRRKILRAAAQAAAIVTVSRSLRERLQELGLPGAKITVLRNGVALEQFQPVDRQAARAELGWRGTVLLSVGRLVELKGHHLAIRALAELPGMRLVVVGDGEERRNLSRLASSTGVADRVDLVGPLPQEKLVTYYGAADALVLASSREGWANVLLESMACGTPVVGTAVGGTPEVVGAPEAGRLVASRTPQGIARGVRSLLADYPDRALTRRYAERFSWSETSRGLFELFNRVCGSQGGTTPTAEPVPRRA